MTARQAFDSARLRSPNPARYVVRGILVFIHGCFLLAFALLTMPAFLVDPPGLARGFVKAVRMLRIGALQFRRVRTILRVRRMTTDLRPPILLLRSFDDDGVTFDRFSLSVVGGGRTTWNEHTGKFEETLEEHIVNSLYRFGPVVAIGRPGQDEVPVGAARHYVEVGDEARRSPLFWLDHVQGLVDSSAVIILLIGPGVGLALEIATLMTSRAVGKILLAFPPNCYDIDTRWRYLQSLLVNLSWGMPDLPASIPFSAVAALAPSRGQGDWTIYWTDPNDELNALLSSLVHFCRSQDLFDAGNARSTNEMDGPLAPEPTRTTSVGRAALLAHPRRR